MSEPVATTYFSALHDEAFSLLVEARNYIVTLRLQGDDGSRKNTDYLDVTLETMRLTTRLTQVMAWILAQKAVQNEEISPEERTSKHYRLSGQSICLDQSTATGDHIPLYLQDLLQRSYDLYCRVSRLEGQICERITAGTDRPQPTAEPRPILRPVKTSGRSPQNAF